MSKNSSKKQKGKRCDLHRHFGGCISAEFVWEAIEKNDWHWISDSYREVKQRMSFAPDEEPNFHRFLNKFDILNSIVWTEDLIDESIKQVCLDLLCDRIDYTWMHFSINKYMRDLKWHRKDAIEFVCDAFKRHSVNCEIGPILCLKYESSRSNQRQIAKLLNEPEVYDNVHGVDLVGDESYYDPGFYRPIFREWGKANKILMAHVGESRSSKNIATAIENLGVREICHGFKVYEHPGLVQLAKDNDVCFHMALTSNYLTGVARKGFHPICTMITDGLPVTVGTDDPVQCSNNLDIEYDALLHEFNQHGYEIEESGPYMRQVRATAVDRVNRYNFHKI
jgi:adenosine deaminase